MDPVAVTTAERALTIIARVAGASGFLGPWGPMLILAAIVVIILLAIYAPAVLSRAWTALRAAKVSPPPVGDVSDGGKQGPGVPLPTGKPSTDPRERSDG